MEATPKQPAPPLQIWVIAGEAYRVWLQNIGPWLKLLAVPVAVIAAGTILSLQIMNSMMQGPVQAPSALSVVAVFVFNVLIYLSQIPLATAWHWLILKTDDPGSHRYMIVGRPEGRYLLKILFVALVVIAVSLLIGLLLSVLVLSALMEVSVGGMPNLLLLGLVSTAISLGVYEVLGFFLGYLLLMLPAAAIGRNYAGSEASAAIKGNEWRLLGVYVVAMLPLIMQKKFLLYWFIGGLALKSGILVAIVQYGPTLLFAPVVIGVLSITYRELVQKQKPEAVGEAPA